VILTEKVKGNFFIFLIAKLILFSIHLFSFSSYKIILVDQYKIDQSRRVLFLPGDMAVDKNENIYFTDRKDGNVKIYGRGGRLLRIFGKQGNGPNEFNEPFNIDVNSNIICIFDKGNFNYFIYNKNFELINKFFFFTDVSEFILSNNRIISWNYFRDKRNKEYRGIIFNFKGKILKLLYNIPFDINDIENRFYLSYAFIDANDKDQFFIIQKKDYLVKVYNQAGEKISEFGEKPFFYKKPHLTRSYLKDLRSHQRSYKAWESWYRDFTWVVGLSSLKNCIIVALGNFNRQKGIWEYWIQLYDENGKYIDTIKLLEPGSPSEVIFLDSNNNDLLFFAEATREDLSEYKIYKYRLIL